MKKTLRHSDDEIEDAFIRGIQQQAEEDARLARENPIPEEDWVRVPVIEPGEYPIRPVTPSSEDDTKPIGTPTRKAAARSPTGTQPPTTKSPTGQHPGDVLRAAAAVVLNPQSSDADVQAAIARVHATLDPDAVQAINTLARKR